MIPVLEMNQINLTGFIRFILRSRFDLFDTKDQSGGAGQVIWLAR